MVNLEVQEKLENNILHQIQKKNLILLKYP